MARGLGLVIAALLFASGCGGGEANEPSQTKSPSPTAAATTDTPRISESTFCRLIFEGQENPIADATDLVREFVDNPDPTQMDREKLEETKASLDSLALRAPESFAPHVLAQGETLLVLIDAHDHPQDGQDISFETFRSSGLEIATACGG